MDLSEDMIAFRFEISYGLSIQSLEDLTNKIYIVHKAYLISLTQTSQEQVDLDVVKCKSPTLEGYYCLDLSKLPNSSLYTDNNQSIQSYLQISTYGCLDTDNLKTTIPQNCASAQEINSVFNSQYSGIKIKIKTSQFNTTSRSIETSYRSTIINTLQNQIFLTSIKIQQQVTTIKEGYLFQTETNFTSALSYGVESQSLQQQLAKQFQNLGSISQALLEDVFHEIK
ncbi:AMP-binding enzyme family protein (macronuclear) [Tetrahymena thermophila SB210]|uniref:AMP-binding enzyme family protein n=1 Tax=Tetrahymena thermophila (strain SB210) TaxID=312017 RepID=Q245Z4_TETTS|nr:AMP-binding enzyme family protein [Tetrahymena thermophila SB210]EAS03489.1 AMP-binding enzyme family protein [Tetrahymena thermophila SB210]|eukprot:XP_001023734.1 AMP-binding enzyme family protein [Tetrahymena thermophila SB210]